VKKKKYSTLEKGREWAISEHVKEERNLENAIRHLENLNASGFGYAKQIALLKQVRTAVACGKAHILTRGEK